MSSTAIKEDDCNVIAYTAWSLLDNFEWAAGYTEKFGLHYVDFSDPDRPRTPKESAGYLARLIIDNGFMAPVTNDLLYDKFPDGFLWGTATSSYQIEGAWNVDGEIHMFSLFSLYLLRRHIII